MVKSSMLPTSEVSLCNEISSEVTLLTDDLLAPVISHSLLIIVVRACDDPLKKLG